MGITSEDFECCKLLLLASTLSNLFVSFTLSNYQGNGKGGKEN